MALLSIDRSMIMLLYGWWWWWSSSSTFVLVKFTKKKNEGWMISTNTPHILEQFNFDQIQFVIVRCCCYCWCWWWWWWIETNKILWMFDSRAVSREKRPLKWRYLFFFFKLFAFEQYRCAFFFLVCFFHIEIYKIIQTYLDLFGVLLLYGFCLKKNGQSMGMVWMVESSLRDFSLT